MVPAWLGTTGVVILVSACFGWFDASAPFDMADITSPCLPGSEVCAAEGWTRTDMNQDLNTPKYLVRKVFGPSKPIPNTFSEAILEALGYRLLMNKTAVSRVVHLQALAGALLIHQLRHKHILPRKSG